MGIVRRYGFGFKLVGQELQVDQAALSVGVVANPLAADLSAAGTYKVTNLADASADGDAVSRKVFDTRSWKNSARAGSLSNVTLSGGGTVGGVVLANGDRFAALGQTDTTTSGLYVVNTGGAWARANDMNSTAKLAKCTMFAIEEGTLAGKVYRLTNTGVVALGSTALAFAEFGAAGATGAPAGTVLKPVRLLATGALAANTYSSSGGGTLTATGNGALVVDGATVALNDEVVLTAEATTANNGIYVVTQVGDGSHPYILTRRADAVHGASIPWGAEVRVTDGAAALRAVVYVDGVVGTAGTVGTDNFKVATPDVRSPLIAPLDGNGKALTNLGNIATVAPTATVGVKDISSSTFTFSGAFWNGSASVANNAVVQHNPLTYGAAVCEAAFDITIAGLAAARLIQNANQVQHAFIIGKRATAAAALGSAEGVGNYFETYGGPFYFLAASVVGDVGYSGAIGHTTSIQMTLWPTGPLRIGTSATDPGLGAGGLRVDGATSHGAAVTLDNNIALQWKDSGAVARTLAAFDGSNVLQLGHASYRTKHLGGRIDALTRPGAYPYTTLNTDRVVLADTSVGSRHITLLNAPADGTVVKYILTGVNGITLDRAGSDTMTYQATTGSTSVAYASSTQRLYTATYDANAAIHYIS